MLVGELEGAAAEQRGGPAGDLGHVTVGDQVDVVDLTARERVADRATDDPGVDLRTELKPGAERDQALARAERGLDPRGGSGAHRRASRGTRGEIPQVIS